jgi:hypothetical protein
MCQMCDQAAQRYKSHMNAQPSARKYALTLEVHNLCEGYTIPQNKVDYLDARHRSSPDVFNLILGREQIVIDEDR